MTDEHQAPDCDHGEKIQATRELLLSIGNTPLFDEDCPIVLSALSDEDALSTRAVRNARILLTAFAEGPQALTAKTRQLNRRFVRRMLDEMEFEGGFAEDRRTWKVLDEDQVRPLAKLRDILQIAGLLRVLHGKLLITRRGQKALEPGGEGDLHLLLFRAYFERCNIAAHDRFQEDGAMQDFIAFTLFRLGIMLRQPMLVPDIVYWLPHDQSVWFPKPEPGRFYFDPEWDLRTALTIRVLEPLEDLGILESILPGEADGGSSDDAHLRRETRKWRITPLFDRFVALSIGGRTVDLGRVSEPKLPEDGGLVSPEERQPVEYTIQAFCGDVAGENEPAARMVAQKLSMLIAAAGDSGGDSTEEESSTQRAVEAIPRVIGMVEDLDAGGTASVDTAFMATAFAAYACWCADAGQVRRDSADRAIASVERWITDGRIPGLG